MKNHFATISIIAFLSLHLAIASDLEQALKPFAAYQYGQSKKVLHDARLTAFRGTNDPAVRQKNEQLLLAFVQSGASPDARREACLWLRDLGTEASLPVLNPLTGQEKLADAAQMAIDAIQARKPEAAEVLNPLASFKEEVLKSQRKLDLLTQALSGEDERRARLAFQLIGEGVATTEATAWLGENLSKLSEARQVTGMNLLVQSHAKEKGAVITKLSRDGSGEARLQAIRLLGNLGRGEDVPFLQERWLGADDAAADAARTALLVMPVEVVRESILRHLQGADARAQGKAIDVAAARGAAFAADALFRIAGEDTNPNQKAAIRALGKAAPPEAFPRVLLAFVEAQGRETAGDLKTAAWELARRQPSYDQAVQKIEAAKANRPEEMAKSLAAMAVRLSGLIPKVSLEDVKNPKAATATPPAGVLLPGSYRSIVPKRFEIAAYLNCGPANKAEGAGVTIECLNGKPWNSAEGVDPSLSLHHAGPTLDYQISGLDAKTESILGFTWWDSELHGRRQSVSINGQEILPDTLAVGFQESGVNSLQKHKSSAKLTPIRIQFSILPGQIKDGACRVRIEKKAGPNVVNSEMWVAKRSQPKAEKQVLLVSGQDYPGHHWRQTGQVMADLIAQDDRMEVTICETPGAVGLQHLDSYDAVFIHFKNYQEDIPATQAMKSKLEAYVKGGGGMCLSHFACGAFMEWPEFVHLSGRIWNGQGHDKRGPFTVKVVDQTHPVTRGLGASFETDDELYFCLTGDPGIHLLCNAFSQIKKEDQPQAFVYEPGKGRVFLSTLGHDVRAYEPEAVKRLYRQGTAWAAGLP